MMQCGEWRLDGIKMAVKKIDSKATAFAMIGFRLIDFNVSFNSTTTKSYDLIGKIALEGFNLIKSHKANELFWVKSKNIKIEACFWTIWAILRSIFIEFGLF